jgi:SepF-like predicted cell division protein (DUF552 family)
MADNIVGTKIVIDSSQAVESVGSIKKQLRDATNDLVSLAAKFGEGSQEAVNAAKRVAELRDRIGDAKSMADAFNPDAKFRAFSQSLQGVAGGFAAVQGAMAVFGVESEDLQKTLVKVQGALALSEGLNTFLDTGIQGFKNLISVIQNSTVVIKANELATKAAAFTMRLFGVEVETTSVAFNVLKGAIAATGIGLLVVALGQAVSAFDTFANSAEDAADKQKEFNNTVKEGARFELDELTKTLDNQMKIDVAKAKSRGASEQEIFDIQQRYAKGKLEAQIRYYDEIKKIDQKAGLDALSNIEKANADGLAAKYEFEAAERKRKEDKRKADKEAADKQRELDFQDYVKNLQAEKQRMDDTFALGEQMMKAESDAKAAQNAADEEELARHNKYILEQELAAAKQREEIAQNEKDAKFKIKMAELDFAQAVVNGLEQIYGRNKQIADVLFLVDKGLAIAKIIVNLQAEMSANAAANATFGAAGLPATVLMNTASKIRAGVSIATIAATTVSRYANQNSSASSAVSGGGMAAPVTPMPIQQTITQLNQGTINALGNQAIKAYVLESDVTNSQNRVTRILNSSRFK